MPIEVRPANLAQVVNYQGKRLLIEQDVTSVAAQLSEVDPHLRLFCAVEADPMYWTVERHVPQADGSVEEQLVLTTQDLGSHVVERVKYIGSGTYDFVRELEETNAKADAAREARFTEQLAEAGEKLAWAIRKDTGEKTRGL